MSWTAECCVVTAVSTALMICSWTWSSSWSLHAQIWGAQRGAGGGGWAAGAGRGRGREGARARRRRRRRGEGGGGGRAERGGDGGRAGASAGETHRLHHDVHQPAARRARLDHLAADVAVGDQFLRAVEGDLHDPRQLRLAREAQRLEEARGRVGGAARAGRAEVAHRARRHPRAQLAVAHRRPVGAVAVVEARRARGVVLLRLRGGRLALRRHVGRQRRRRRRPRLGVPGRRERLGAILLEVLCEARRAGKKCGRERGVAQFFRQARERTYDVDARLAQRGVLLRALAQNLLERARHEDVHRAHLQVVGLTTFSRHDAASGAQLCTRGSDRA